ncbi:MAG: hypothetical protein AAGH99_08110 [Planctomycetota bacterium]
MKRLLSSIRLGRPHPRDLRRWLLGGAVLVLVWAGVGSTVQAARDRIPQAADVTAEARQVSVLPVDAAARAERIEALIGLLQRLSLDDRLDPELIDAVEAAVAEMTPDEQLGFVRGLMPPGLEPMLRAFQAMDEAQRRRAIDRMEREFRRSEWLAEDADPEMFTELVETATRGFLDADNPEAQLDLLPTMQKILRAMQNPG